MSDGNAQTGLDASDIGLIVLAAGLSNRFGPQDKLAADLHGKAVAHHILPALEGFNWGTRALVCRQGSRWIDAYRQAGFHIIVNDNGQGGMLSSLHAGLAATENLPQTLICLADMPFIDKSVIRTLLKASSRSSGQVLACRAEHYSGPPAIFPTPLLNLLPKEGEGGARALLANATFIDFPPAMLRDIDTVDDLEMAAQGGAAIGS